MYVKSNPLQPLLVINMYMSTHLDDATLINNIINTIFQVLLQRPQSFYLLVGDFTRDIFLHGCFIDGHYTLTPNEISWQPFTHNIHLCPIPNQSIFTRQGPNYTSLNLANGYYCTSSTTQTLIGSAHLNLTSDHFPVTLTLPPNVITTRSDTQTPVKFPQLINPISQATLQQLNAIFFTSIYNDISNYMIATLTLLPHPNMPTPTQLVITTSSP